MSQHCLFLACRPEVNNVSSSGRVGLSLLLGGYRLPRFRISPAAWGLVALLAPGTPTSLTTQESAIVMCAGKTRSRTFRQQVTRVRRHSSDQEVAIARLNRPSDGWVTIEAKRPGRATITITGETVHYVAGRNRQLAEYRPFRSVVRVEVQRCGDRRERR